MITTIQGANPGVNLRARVNMAYSDVKIIGILRADFGGEALAKKHGLYHNMFVDLFHKVKPELEFKIYDVPQGEKPTRADECDAYIITGSRAGIYEHDKYTWINDILAIVLNISRQDIPQAGICFGHQVLALAFGGEVAKSDKGWGVGVSSYQTTDSANKNMVSLPNEFSIIAIHQDQVVEKPPAAKIIASSSFCPIAALESTRNNFISFQGHPEFIDGLLVDIMNSRIDSIGADKVERASKSLADPTNEEAIAKTMLEFFAKQISNRAIQESVA